MTEGVRELLYPMGYLATLAFAARFLLQWVTSEVQRKSVVTAVFWKISLAGNLMLMIHGLVQLQFHVCVIQACNAIISWRNLDFMAGRSQRLSFRSVVGMMLVAVGAVFGIFILQGILWGEGRIEWFRLPVPSWDNTAPLPVGMLWHSVGFIGLALFSSRFWVQWWNAERDQSSTLGLPFWWLSLIGGLLTSIYFIRIEDPVNLIGPLFGLIPYVRNLILMQRAQTSAAGTP